MSTRNVLALWVAGILGFSLGLLEAMERLPYSQTLRLGAVGLAVTVAVALLVALRVRGHALERLFVALLRAGLSGGVFVFIFEGMRLLDKRGHVGEAVASWVFAGILALLLARLAPAGGRGGSADRDQLPQATD